MQPPPRRGDVPTCDTLHRMRLSRLRFTGFKSLRDVSCELDQITVLTGPNGAGKSNIVDAINLLSECFQYDLEIAVARAGGYDNITHRGLDADSSLIRCKIEIDFTISEVRRYSRINRRQYLESSSVDDDSLWLSYDFELIRVSNDAISDFKIHSEHLELRDPEGLVLRIIRQTDGDTRFWRAKRMKGNRSLLALVLYPFSEDRYLEFFKNTIGPTTLLIKHFPNSGGITNLVSNRLGQAKVFQLSPHQCRNSGVSTPNATLERHGENLPSVAEYLKKNKPEAWQKIESAMRAILPRLISIDTTFTQDRRLALQFSEDGLDRPWNSNEVSDGTVQTLALFVALFDPRSPILIVEEPENALHPWILRHFLDLCREQRMKQIVLTTHSPILIDSVSPENVRLMWNREGETHLERVSTLEPSVVDLWKSGDLRSFDIYDSGLISEYLPEEYVYQEPV